MKIVPNRTHATLLPIIQAHTLAGTIIYSDDFSSYSNAVGQLPNILRHSIVNHSLNFVDPATGAHIQHIESYWNRVKLRFKCIKGLDTRQLPSIFG